MKTSKISWYNFENPGFANVCQMYFDIFHSRCGNKQRVYSSAYNIALCYHPRDPLFWHAPSTPLPTWHYFTNDLGDQNRHLVKIHVRCYFVSNDPVNLKFAYDTAAQLSRHEQSCDMVWSFPSSTIYQDFDNEFLNPLWDGTLCNVSIIYIS